MIPRAAAYAMLAVLVWAPAQAASDWARLLQSPPGGVAIWTESSAYKAFPDDAPPAATAKSVQLSGAQGERVCCQLVFRAPTPIRPVVTLEPLRGAAAIIPGPRAVRYVGWTNGTLRSGPEGRLGKLPDPLMEEPISAPANTTLACWLQMDVGEAPPGDYTGRVRVQLAQGEVAFPVRLTVWDAQVPRVPTIQVKGNVWGNYLRSFDQRPTAEAMADYEADLLDHRVTVGAFTANFKLAADGGIEADFADVPAQIRAQVARGFQRFWVPNAFLGDASGWEHRRPWRGLDPATPEFEQAYADYVRKLADTLRAAGLLDRVLIEFWDEPAEDYYDRINHLAGIIRQAAPDLKIFTSEQPEPALDAAIDAWCVALPNWYNEPRAEEHRARGDEIWCYDNGRYATDYPALHMRSYPWVVAKQRFAGVLWWCINYWRGNPYENATPEPVETPGGQMYSYTPGNGSLLYPNPAGEGPPVASLRWEQFREGMEEAELLLALTRARAEVADTLGDPSFDAHRHTRELAGLVAASVADYDPDAAHFEAARAQLAQELQTTGAAPLMLCHLDPLTDGPTTREQLQVVGLAADGASVSVAGKPVARQGRAFAAQVALAVGRNRIPVVARAGKATKTVTLTAVRTTPLLEQLRSLFADMQRWGPDLSALRRQLEGLVDAGKYTDARGQALLQQARGSLQDWIAKQTVLPQGSFEEGLKGWNNAGDIACTVSDTAFVGAHSLQVRDDSPDRFVQYFSDMLPARPGQDYLLVGSGLVKSVTGPRNHTFRVSIQFFAGGKYLGGCERALFWDQRNDNWETKSVRATAPADADHLRATVVSCKENVGEALLDDLAIVAVDR